MRIQLSDRDKVKRVIVQEQRELEIQLTLNPREAMLLKNLFGQVYSSNTSPNGTRDFTDSIYWRLSELGVPGLAKQAFAFEHQGIKALSDLECHLFSESECQQRFAANRDYINQERDAGRLVHSYKFPFSSTSSE